MIMNSWIIRLSFLLAVAILDGLSRVECGRPVDHSFDADTMENFLILNKGQAMLGNQLLREPRPYFARLRKSQIGFVQRRRIDMGKKVGLGGAMSDAFGPDDGPAEGVNLGYQHNILHPGADLSVDPTAFKPRSLMDSLAAGAFAKAQAGEVKPH